MSFQHFSCPKKPRKRILLPNLLFPEYNITFYWQLATRCSCGRMFFQLTWRAAGWGSAVISTGAQPRARNPRAVVAESCNYLNNVRAWPKPKKPSSKSSQWKRSSPVFCCPWQGDTNNGAHICPVSYVPAWVLSEGGFCVCICGCICIGGRVSVSVSESLQLFAIRAAIDAGQVLASWKLKCRGSGKGRSYGMVWGHLAAGRGPQTLAHPPHSGWHRWAGRYIYYVYLYLYMSLDAMIYARGAMHIALDFLLILFSLFFFLSPRLKHIYYL